VFLEQLTRLDHTSGIGHLVEYFVEQ